MASGTDGNSLEPALVFDPLLQQAAQRAFASLTSTMTPAMLADTIAQLGFDQALGEIENGAQWPDAACVLRAQAGAGVALDMAAWLVLNDRALATAPRTLPYELRRPAWLATSTETIRVAMCLSRCLQISAAIEAAIDLSLQYVRDRRQFGRPLAAFQAVQHQLAVAAGEAAAARTLTDFTLAAVSRHGLNAARVTTLLRSAGLVTAQAVTVCLDVTHQVHGAMGFTRDYPLHRHSLDMLHWRDELLFAQQGELRCAEALGRQAVAADSLWSFITDSMQS